MREKSKKELRKSRPEHGRRKQKREKNRPGHDNKVAKKPLITCKKKKISPPYSKYLTCSSVI